MTKYQLQAEIYKMAVSTYPDIESQNVKTYLAKLWKMNKTQLEKTYKAWKDITA
jgi:hypothetical protein